MICLILLPKFIWQRDITEIKKHISILKIKLIISHGTMFNGYWSIANFVWSTIKILPIYFYNLLRPSICLNKYKRIFLIYAPNLMVFLSESLIFKIIFQNIACFMLLLFKRPCRLYIILVLMFGILWFLKNSNTIIVKSLKVFYEYSLRSIILSLSIADQEHRRQKRLLSK